MQLTSFSLRYVNCGHGHMQCTYSSTYLGFNSQLNVSRALLEICRAFNAPYTANMVPHTVHILHFTLRNCGPGHIHCKYSSAYSGFNIQLNVSALLLETRLHFDAHYTANIVPNTAQCPPDYAMWTVVPAIYNVVTAPHI
jgi:hypothetical protein